MSGMAGSDKVRHPSPAVKLTYDDFVRFPDDGQRHELIDGEHYVTAAPNVRHQAIVGNFYLIIRSWLEDHPLGRVFLSPFDVVFSDFDVVEPDLLYLSNERAAQVLTPLHANGVPELLIEIISKSTRTRDETIKRDLYQRMGVSEYLVIDPQLDLIHIHRRDGSAFCAPIELSRERSDVIASPLLPGLSLPLVRIFKE